eukprot:TRINITY_DN7095_c0_g2_i9.p1 TRINITY_DN7095_c0_g2~~TRINITY_DN7095_c0_g2_i9.p1  ORF type:complete len:232 (-),score=78.67 TRINITY_DN7095_c0_g2_i9:17-712(-)
MGIKKFKSMEEEENNAQTSKELKAPAKKTQEYYTAKLRETGIIEAYEYLLRSLCKYGLPTNNVFEFAALSMLKYEKKWKVKKHKELQERIRQRQEEKKKVKEEERLRKEREEEEKAKERKRLAKLIEKRRKEAEEARKEAETNQRQARKANQEDQKAPKRPEGRVLAPLSKAPGRKLAASRSPIRKDQSPDPYPLGRRGGGNKYPAVSYTHLTLPTTVSYTHLTLPTICSV